jgi:hypothetical protein
MKQTAKLFSSLFLAVLAGLILSSSSSVSASPWNGIEPLKTRRDEVIKKLGAPLGETPDGVLRFNVMGGSVQVRFVNESFIKSKKLRPDLAGTVLEIILQHEHSSDTPESLKLADNHSFVKDESKGTTVFTNLKEGLIYTFIDGSLRTTRYTFANEQLTKARR